MHNVLLVYKQVEMQFDDNGEIIVSGDYVLTIIVSYDKKTDIQAVANISDDLSHPAGMVSFAVIMSINVWEPYLCWQGSICSPAKQSL